MNRLTLVLLIAATVAAAGCGSSGGGDKTANTPAGTDVTVALANQMITQATSDECPTSAHCERWPVEQLVQPTSPEDAKTIDL